MSEEEKKAIDYLQLCYDLSTIDNESLPKLATILNLIEKQDKIIKTDEIMAKEDAKYIKELKEKVEKQDKIIDKAINEIEILRQDFDESLQCDFIRILEILKDKKVIDW